MVQALAPRTSEHDEDVLRTSLRIWNKLDSGGAGETGTTTVVSTRDIASRLADSVVMGVIPPEMESVDESPAVLGPEEEAAEGEGKAIQLPVLPGPWVKTT
jgi:hypothetical protein